ncbi:2318_t:CDS:2 [Entrophospora sp. SA101]|nr:2318_t:CDS:2 [Entrophospora sp. SA101]
MSTEDTILPFVQFPVQPAFALTINKSQGQMLPYVGLYLPQPIFSWTIIFVLAPSEFSSTFGELPSITATQELVVPKSIPTTGPLTPENFPNSFPIEL